MELSIEVEVTPDVLMRARRAATVVYCLTGSIAVSEMWTNTASLRRKRKSASRRKMHGLHEASVEEITVELGIEDDEDDMEALETYKDKEKTLTVNESDMDEKDKEQLR